ncbi:MAG TPA: DUF480 domain-containing protein [Acidimicrobiales bacterium]|nr:DUF480 domain-containing protein [Acidimicrobiales bacterium]
MELTAVEARVLGSLVEKELATPQQYPLTMAALVAACNQTSNRDPVVSYDEDGVSSALDSLKEQRLVRFVLPSHGRSVVRYRNVLDEARALDVSERALLAVLLLRGPQTVGELRARTERMTQFDSLNEVEHELSLLASLDVPLARKLHRRPGQKEERWECPCSPAHPAPPEGEGGDEHGEPVLSRSSSSGDRMAEIRVELATLRSMVDDLRRDLDALRQSLGE